MGVCVADRDADCDSLKHGQCPSGGNRDPSGVFCLGSREQNATDNPVSEQNQHHRSNKLAEHCTTQMHDPAQYRVFIAFTRAKYIVRPIAGKKRSGD